MKKKTLAIAIGCIVLLAAIGVGAGCQNGNEPLATPTAVNSEDEYTPGPTPEIPKLTEEERGRAREIALSDPGVQELSEGKDWSICRVGVWHTSKHLHYRKIGAALEMCFDERFWIEYDWPLIEYDEGKYDWPHYREVIWHKGLWVEELEILVNLEEERVVAINPKEK